MSRKWLWGGAAIAVGVVAWSEYRLWSHRERPGLLQSACLVETAPALAGIPSAAADEESDAPPLIDLTPLQLQTPEPPMAEGEWVVPLPSVAKFGAEEVPADQSARTAPADFLPHSADADDCCKAH